MTAPMRDGDILAIALPPTVRAVLERLAGEGHDVALVGGSVRDLVAGHEPKDWDAASAAPPETVAALFPSSTWENRFGTVTVHGADGQAMEVTTYRHEGPYQDRRRPSSVRW